MLEPDEIKLDKKAIVGKPFRVIDFREEEGMLNIPFFVIHIGFNEQASKGKFGYDEKNNKTVIFSDKYTKRLIKKNELFGAGLMIESFEKPENRYWYYKYKIIEKGKKKPEKKEVSA